MKSFAPPILGRPFKTFATVLVALSAITASQAGFLDLLRGEVDSGTSSFQRVAFVGSAKVKEVEGQAERLVGIDSWRPLEKGTELAPGDIVRTRSGIIVLRMKESGSFVKVTPQTILRLLNMEEHWDKGTLFGSEHSSGFAVRSCRGKAQFRAPGEDWKDVEVNTVLAAGSEIRTEPGTILDLYDTDKQRPVRIQGSVMLKLHESLLANRTLVRPDLIAVIRP
jgi:hypothetical protein